MVYNISFGGKMSEMYRINKVLREEIKKLVELYPILEGVSDSEIVTIFIKKGIIKLREESQYLQHNAPITECLNKELYVTALD
jgi:hypothetical protein